MSNNDIFILQYAAGVLIFARLPLGSSGAGLRLQVASCGPSCELKISFLYWVFLGASF
jgi:hypothetical protein